MGAVRDLDVLIARFEKELGALPEAEQADIRRLIETFAAGRRRSSKADVWHSSQNLKKPVLRNSFLTFFTGFDRINSEYV